MTTNPTPPTPKKFKWGEHPNSRKNLKPFPPGTNGNPHPGCSLTLLLKDALVKELQKPSDKAPAHAHLIYSTLKGALKREAVPFKEVWDRVEGKVAQPISGEGGGPVIVKVVYDSSTSTEGVPGTPP